MTPEEYINSLADQMRDNLCISIEGAVYTQEEFPPEFWRKLAKEVNFLSQARNNCEYSNLPSVNSYNQND